MRGWELGHKVVRFPKPTWSSEQLSELQVVAGQMPGIPLEKVFPLLLSIHPPFILVSPQPHYIFAYPSIQDVFSTQRGVSIHDSSPLLPHLCTSYFLSINNGPGGGGMPQSYSGKKAISFGSVAAILPGHALCFPVCAMGSHLHSQGVQHHAYCRLSSQGFVQAPSQNSRSLS